MPIKAGGPLRFARDLLGVPELIEKYAAAGLNRVQVTQRKVASQVIRSDSPLKAAWVKKAIRIKKASRESLRVGFFVTERGIPLRLQPLSGDRPYYRASRRITRGRQRIKAKLDRGPMKPIPGAFAHMHVRRGVVMKRVGRDRYPLKSTWGPTIFSLYNEKPVEVAMDRTWDDRAPIELRRAEDRALKQKRII